MYREQDKHGEAEAETGRERKRERFKAGRISLWGLHKFFSEDLLSHGASLAVLDLRVVEKADMTRAPEAHTAFSTNGHIVSGSLHHFEKQGMCNIMVIICAVISSSFSSPVLSSLPNTPEF